MNQMRKRTQRVNAHYLTALALLTAGCCSLPALEGWAASAPELVICAFQPQMDFKLWQGCGDHAKVTLEPRNPQDADYKLKVVYEGGDCPGIGLPKPPADWSPYEVFSFEVWSPANASMELRVDDANSKGYTTRLNYPFRISKGRNLVQVPIDKIRRTVDVRQIKLVKLFSLAATPGFTLYYDRFRLGPLEEDVVPFIPYSERSDTQPTLDVRTPHFEFGRNLSGGPLQAFAIASVLQGRNVSELMQRIDAQIRVVTWGRQGDANSWGLGNCYSERGAPDDQTVMQRYLASSIQGPEKFETMILTTPMGWRMFPQGARERILNRVEQDGAGLILIMPFPGGENAPGEWTDELRKVCALIDSPSDYLNWDHNETRGAKAGIIPSKKWRVVGDHPITSGVPLEALPTAGSYDKQIMDYKLAPGAQVLIETEDDHPVMAVKQVGKGRVITFAFRAGCLSPSLRVDADNRMAKYPYRYWEVWYNLLARSAYWAAGRTFKREGEGVPLVAQGEDADPCLHVKQWKDPQGLVTDWQMEFTPPPVISVLRLTVPEMVEHGKDIPVEIPLWRCKDYEKAKWHLTVAEPSIGEERILESVDVDVTGAHAPTKEQPCVVNVPTLRLTKTAALLHLTATRDGNLVAEARATVLFAPNQVWDDFEIHCWGGNEGLPFFDNLERRMEKQLGATCQQTSNPAGMAGALANGFRNQFMAGVNGLHVSLGDIVSEYSRTKDPTLLVRKPSLTDPEELAKRHQETRDRLTKLAPYKPLSGILADETALTSYTVAFDFDFHPANIAAFRKKLEARFKTVEAMNQALCLGKSNVPATPGHVEVTAELPLCKFTPQTDLTPWQATSSGVTLTLEPAVSGTSESRLKVEHAAAAFPGLTLLSLPADWSAYDGFAFTVWSSVETQLGVRIDDAKSSNYASRFNDYAKIKPGQNTVTIPISRMKGVLETRQIKLVALFLEKPAAGTTLYYNNIRLTPPSKRPGSEPATSFAGIIPPTTAEAKESGNWGLWNEWRAHNDDMWTQAMQDYADWFDESCPGIRCSLSGTQSSTPLNGIDWAKMTKPFRSIVGYRGRYQDLQRLCFHPTRDFKSLSWVGYGSKGLAAHYQMWENLLTGDSGCGVFWWISMRNPDLTWSQSAKDYMTVFDVFRRGLGKQYQLARRDFSPVAVLWSANSQRAAYASDRFEKFVADEKDVVDSLRAAGFDPFFISEEQVLAGELKAKGAKALFLPMTLSLGMGTQPGGTPVWPAIKAFLDEKGVVVTTAAPACDEFLQPLTPPSELTEQAVSLSSITNNLAGELARRGVHPKVVVGNADGSPLAALRTYVHSLRADDTHQGFIVSFLRPPPNSKTTIGADGVPRVESSSEAGKPASCGADCRGIPYAACYEQSSGRRITAGSDAVPVQISAAEGKLLTFLPYVVTGVEVKAKTADRVLDVHWRIAREAGDGKFVPHVVRVDVLDSTSGQANSDLGRNVTSGADGQGEVMIPLSISEASRKWAIRVTDILTGLQGRKEL